MPRTKPKRYGKPCMTNLPPELGRSIINTIMNTPPPDLTKLKRKAAQAEHRLSQIAAELERNASATN